MAISCMDQIQPLRDFKTEPRINRQTIMFSSLDFNVFNIFCDVRVTVIVLRVPTRRKCSSGVLLLWLQAHTFFLTEMLLKRS